MTETMAMKASWRTDLSGSSHIPQKTERGKRDNWTRTANYQSTKGDGKQLARIITPFIVLCTFYRMYASSSFFLLIAICRAEFTLLSITDAEITNESVPLSNPSGLYHVIVKGEYVFFIRHPRYLSFSESLVRLRSRCSRTRPPAKKITTRYTRDNY